MSAPFRVAIVGCGRMGEQYAQAYATYPDTEIVAIAEHDPDRRKDVGERFGVTALYPDVHALLAEVVPDMVAVVTPTKYYKDAVIACAEAGVKGVSTDKPIAAVLADADEMVQTCQARGVVFAGGNLQRAMSEVQEAARRIRAGHYGPIIGASVHRWGGEISGGGCQNISVLRLLADAEVDEVIAWGTPAEALAGDTDEGLIIHGRFHLSNGLDCPVFGTETPYRGVEVWSEDALIRWDWGPPEIFQGYDAHGVSHAHRAALRPLPLERVRVPDIVHPFVSASRGDGQRAVDIGPRPAAGAGGGHRRQGFGAARQRTGQAPA